MMDESRRPPEDPNEKPASVGGAGVTDGNLAHSMELTEFMERLGMVFKLPSRRQSALAAAVAAAAAKPTASPSRRAVPGIMIVALLFSLAAGYLFYKPDLGADRLPEDAIGRWVTTDPRYANRGFDLDSTTVVFHTGATEGDVTRHPVLGTTVRNEHGRQVVTIEYGLGDGSMRLAFWIEPGANLSLEPTIRLMNQQEIAWRRAAAGRGE